MNSLVNKVNDPVKYQKLVETFERIRDEIYIAFKTIFDKKDWCSRALCRDAEGEQLFYPLDPTAVSWCLLGAVYKQENYSEETLTFMTSYARKKGIEDLSRYNDQEGHVAVIMLLVDMLDTLGVSMTFYDDDGKEVATL